MSTLTEMEFWLIRAYFSQHGLGAAIDLRSALSDIELELQFYQAEEVIGSLIEKGILSLSPDHTKIRFTQEGTRSFRAALNRQRAWEAAPAVPVAATAKEEMAKEEKELRADEGDDVAVSTTAPDIFISHSSKDEELAEILVEFLQSALRLRVDQIRCTSVPGFRLQGGADTDETVRREVREAKMLLGLLSQASLRSTYVAFELGARWGAKLPFIPLLAPGVEPAQLEGPIASYNALRCGAEDLHQLIADLGKHLGIPPEPAAMYQKHINRILALPASRPAPVPPTTAPSTPNSALTDLSKKAIAVARRLRTEWRTDKDSGAIPFAGMRRGMDRFISAAEEFHAALTEYLAADDLEALEELITRAKKARFHLDHITHDFDQEGVWRLGFELFDALEEFALPLGEP